MLYAETASIERARLLARIRREFAVVEDVVSLGERRLPFVRVADADAVLDAVCAQAELEDQGVAPKRELRMPYWAAVWESGVALAEHLAGRGVDHRLAGLSVLDLGCGMGVVGAAMALLGGRVTLADIDTASLLFARLNTLAWSDRARVVRCDWHGDDLGARFDLIAGGDVLYDADQWAPIEAFARRHLAAQGVLLLGEPGRLNADRFPAWLESLGWSIARSTRVVGERTVRIYEAHPNG
ncbi:MAG TPA: methyltransferase [Caulobacteraceae bacterium]|nr:methyltransferase [Caulobacteraceae bacterium]